MTARFATKSVRAFALRRIVTLSAFLPLFGCDTEANSNPDPAQTSPNVQIAPAPLLSGRSLVSKPQGSVASARTGSVPTSRPLESDPFSLRVAEPAEETSLETERVPSGVFLDAEFSWVQQRKATFFGLKTEEASQAQASAQRRLSVDLSSYDRLRISLETDAFPLSRQTAFLARQDRDGFLLVWPDQESYRVVPRGALRALFREHRLDVTPLIVAEVKALRTGKRFELPSQVQELSTSHGVVELEQVNVPLLGYGGALLCRFLLEFIAAASSPEVCRDNMLPVNAHFRLLPQGELLWTVKNMEPSVEPSAIPVLVPPPNAEFVTKGLPEVPLAIVEARFRAALHRASASADIVDLNVSNPGHIGSYLLLEGVPVGFFAPQSQRVLPQFRAADYEFSALSFLGEPTVAPKRITLPSKVNVGTRLQIDAGAP